MGDSIRPNLPPNEQISPTLEPTTCPPSAQISRHLNPNLWSTIKTNLIKYKSWIFPPPQSATPKGTSVPPPRSNKDITLHPDLRGSPSPPHKAPSLIGIHLTDTFCKEDLKPPSVAFSPPADLSDEEDFLVCKKLQWDESPPSSTLLSTPPPPPPSALTPATHPPNNLIQPTPEQNLLGLLLNVRSLPCHRIEIRDLLDLHNPDIVLLTETWLGDDANPVIHTAIPPNYRALLANRDSRGGGLGIFMKDHIPMTRDLSFSVPDCEHLLAKCSFDHYSKSFLLIYRPPNKNYSFPRKFADAVSNILTKHQDLIVLGDFNIWVEDPRHPMAGPFLRYMEALGFTQGVKEVTHKDGHWLDGIYHIEGQVKPRLPVLIPWTDHRMIPFHIPTTAQEKKRELTISSSRNWKALNCTDTLIPEMLKNIPPGFLPMALGSEQSSFPNLNEVLLSQHITSLDSWITRALDKVLPCKPRSHHNSAHNAWFNKKTNSLKRAMRLNLRIWQNDRSVSNLLKYKTALRQYRSLLHTTKRTFFSNRIETSTCPSRELFRIIEEFKGNREPVTSFDTTIFCIKMANHFVAKESTLHDKIESIAKTIGSHQSTEESTCTSAKLSMIKPLDKDEFTKLMNSSKTAGSQDDPCPPNIYKLLSLHPIIGDVIRRIINSSLILGIVPPEFKSAHIKPLLKKAGLDPSDGNNFRGLTKSRLIPKISEKIVSSQFNTHIEKNSCLDPYQAGFRAKHSTESILVGLCDELKTQVDGEGIAALILLDLSAAFDTVDHQILLSRLDKVGITDSAKNWVASFLKGRSLQVSTANHSSTPFQTRFGVPQGSPLSPLLFNIYLTPLLKIIHSHGLTCFNYADDTQMIYKIRSSASASAQDLEGCMLEVARWMTSNHLLINPGKTELLICSAGKPQHWDLPWPRMLGDRPNSSEVVKSLGYHINQRLNPRDHVKTVSKTCFSLMRNLRRILPYLRFPQQVTAVMALILSRIDYANALLAGGPQDCIDILQRTQNAAARLLTKVKPWDHITPSLISLRWLPVSRRVTFKILCLTFQAYHNTGPAFLNKAVTKKTLTRDLRNSGDKLLDIPKMKTKRMGEATFSFQGPSLWNALPNHIRNIEEFSAFKKALKNWLFISFEDDNLTT